MNTDWQNRLAEIVDADPRSLRAISMDANLGPNYLFQMIKGGKQPTIDKLYAILDQFQDGDALYVLLGVRITRADLGLLHSLSELPPGAQENFRSFLQSLRDGEGAGEQSPEIEG